jgi:hypothetical protein
LGASKLSTLGVAQNPGLGLPLFCINRKSRGSRLGLATT